MQRISQSILAVIAGAITGLLLTIGTDAILHATGAFPPQGQRMGDALFILATVYRTVYGVAGSYIAARLAPYQPMSHALVLGAIGVVVCILGAVVTWDKGPEFGPHWYPLALVVLTMPQSWAGGKLRELQVHPLVLG